MAFAQPSQPARQPTPIHRHAADNLRFIRDTMERAGSFTAVPGMGGVAIGITALIAGTLALHRPIREQFLVWELEAVVALAIAILTVRAKSRRQSLSLQSRPARRALLSFAPPLIAGAVLTFILRDLGIFTVIPGLWLLLYGAAVVTGGAFSVRIVPVMGLCFMCLGLLSFLLPGVSGDLFLTLGFGVVHIAFGIEIARRHGG